MRVRAYIARMINLGAMYLMERRTARAQRLRDLSQSFADPSMAAKHRTIVDEQLAAMRAGDPPEHFRVTAELLEQIRLKTGGRSLAVLDAGCGSAHYVEILDFLCLGQIDYVGADFNPGMLAEARAYYPGSSLVRMDLRSLAFRAESFDVVLSSGALVNIPKWETAVREMVRVTRRWLLLHRTLVSPGEHSTTVRVGRAYGRWVDAVCIGEAALMDLMGDLGFHLVASRDSGEGRFQKGQENNSYLWLRQPAP